MGYITSNTWLDVGFGEALKKFFLDHFKILAIVEFDAAVFGKALVNTCVSILEKSDDHRARTENTVKFVRVKKPMNIDEVVNNISMIDENYEGDQLSIVLKKQVELKPEERWGKYIRAQAIFFKIVSHPKITRLGNLAEVEYGIKTGSNEFFLVNDEKVRLWGIEDEYLKLAVTSNRDVKFIQLLPKDIKCYMLMVHEPKDSLKGKNVLKYLDYGEQMEITTKRGTRVAAAVVKGVQNLTSVKHRKLWYDLGKSKVAPILFPYLMWERSLFVLNQAEAYVTDNLHEIYPHSKENTLILLGLLNSTLTAMLLELYGRSYGGGVLKIQTYELKELPIPDPRKISLNARKKIENALLIFADAQRKNDKRAVEEAQKELDNAVFDVLGLTESERKQVYEGLEALRQMRFQRKEVEVLVETSEKWMPPKKPERKRKIVEEELAKRLDSWIKL